MTATSSSCIVTAFNSETGYWFFAENGIYRKISIFQTYYRAVVGGVMKEDFYGLCLPTGELYGVQFLRNMHNLEFHF